MLHVGRGGWGLIGLLGGFCRISRTVCGLFLYRARGRLHIEPDARLGAQEIPLDLIRLVSDRWGISTLVVRYS